MGSSSCTGSTSSGSLSSAQFGMQGGGAGFTTGTSSSAGAVGTGSTVSSSTSAGAM